MKPQKNQHKLLAIIREVSEVMKYNISIQKLLGFIFQHENEENTLYKRETPNRKYLAINLKIIEV